MAGGVGLDGSDEPQQTHRRIAPEEMYCPAATGIAFARRGIGVELKAEGVTDGHRDRTPGQAHARGVTERALNAAFERELAVQARDGRQRVGPARGILSV